MTEPRTAGRWAAAILAVLLLAGPVHAALTDSEGWAHLEEMEKHGVLRDPHWAQAYWSEALAAPTPQERIHSLHWALRFDPEMTEARWALCRALLANRDPDFVNQIVLVAQLTWKSFLVQQGVAVWVLTIGGLALLSALLIASLTAVLRTLPRLHHGIWERLHFLPAELRSGAALLTLLLPAMLTLTLPPTAMLFWLLLLGLVAAWSELTRTAQRRGVAALVMLLMAPLALAAWTRVVEPMHPDSYLRALWTVQGSADGIGAFRGTAPPEPALQDPAYYATVALAERRDGDYRRAIAHLEKAIELDSSRWAYFNNLGNAQLLAGEIDDALDSYARAQSLSPAQPLIHVNEAQAWMRKLSFTRADKALGEAARLGYRMPKLLNTGPSDVIVRDEVLDAGQMWLRFTHGQSGPSTLPWKRAGLMMLAPLMPYRPVWLSLALLLAVYFAAQARHLPRSHACAGCGRPICRKCHFRVLRRSLCGACNTIRQDVRAPLKREEMLRERRRRVIRWPSLAGTVTAVLFPGTGQQLAGRPRRGVLTLFFSMALVLITGAGALWPSPRPALPAEAGWSAWIPVAAFALLALASVRTYFRFMKRAQSIGLSETEEA